MEVSRSGHMVGSEDRAELHGSSGTEGTWLQLVCCTFLMYSVSISDKTTYTEMSSIELIRQLCKDEEHV